MLSEIFLQNEYCYQAPVCMFCNITFLWQRISHFPVLQSEISQHKQRRMRKKMFIFDENLRQSSSASYTKELVYAQRTPRYVLLLQ